LYYTNTNRIALYKIDENARDARDAKGASDGRMPDCFKGLIRLSTSSVVLSVVSLEKALLN
jgi:hypothetical protein